MCPPTLFTALKSPPPLPLPELHVLDDVPSFIFVQAKYSVEVWLLCSCSFCCFFNTFPLGL